MFLSCVVVVAVVVVVVVVVVVAVHFLAILFVILGDQRCSFGFLFLRCSVLFVAVVVIVEHLCCE